MKFLHISDLHLGKRLGEFRLYEEQKTLLGWVVETARNHGVNGILLAGDIYDRSVPPVEAVALFDAFLTDLRRAGIPLYAISGNHDAAERVSYGSALFTLAGIHFSAVFDGQVRCVPVEEDGTKAYIHLLPFLKPVHVREAYREVPAAETDPVENAPDPAENPDGTAEQGILTGMSYTEALAQVVSRMTLPGDGVNILLCHQFLTGSTRSESEEIPLVGTLDAVDSAVFRDFDYVALGHLHRCQRVGDNCRYSGSLMPYAFSEKDDKGALLVTVDGREISSVFLPVPAGLVRGMAVLEGTYDTLIRRDYRENCPHREDFLQIVLEEDTPVPDAMAKLGLVYPRLLQLTYKKRFSDSGADSGAGLSDDRENLSPADVFASFFARQNGVPPTEEDMAYITALLAEEAEGEDR